ncbi:MAG: type II secretion system protein GspL [Desulfosalsimonadaceae bacterium]
MSRIYFCLDVREDAVSALLLESGLKGLRVQSRMHVPLRKPGDTENPWHEALASILEHMDTRGAICLLAFPPALASYRNLRLPFTDRRKIRQVLPFEVEPLLPFALDEAILDFQLVRREGSADVIAAAVEKTRLQPILRALSEFRLYPQRIMPAGFPAALCLAARRPEENFFYIDADASTTTIFAISLGSIYLVRSVYTGGASHEHKMRTLATNIQRLQVTFETVYGFDFAPERVFFSGSWLYPEAVAAAVGEHFSVSAEAADMTRQAGLDVSPEIEPGALAYINNCLCLAAVDVQRIGGINFFQQKNLLYHYWEEYRPDFIKSAVIAALVLLLGMGGVLFEIHRLGRQVGQMENRIESVFQSTFPGVSRIVDPLQQMQVKLRQARQRDLFAGLQTDGVKNIDILNDASRLIPDSVDVVISRFVKSEKSVLISGHTDTFNAVDEIKGNLGKSPNFNAITITSANMDQSVNRVQFRLKLEIAENQGKAG